MAPAFLYPLMNSELLKGGPWTVPAPRKRVARERRCTEQDGTVLKGLLSYHSYSESILSRSRTNGRGAVWRVLAVPYVVGFITRCLPDLGEYLVRVPLVAVDGPGDDDRTPRSLANRLDFDITSIRHGNRRESGGCQHHSGKAQER